MARAYCGCTGSPAQKYQDKTYGMGFRVLTIKKDKVKGRCTCCGKEHVIKSS